MKWLVRLGVVGVILAAAYWFEVLDGGVPSTPTYKTDIAAWRQLVSGDGAQLPSEIRIEIVGRDSVPLAAMQAGAAFDEYPRVRAAFQLNGPSGSVIIDTTFDKETAVKAQRTASAQFDEAAYGRVISAMGVATKVAVTHEHPDHIGGAARFPLPERLAERLVLTRAQYAGMGSATADGKIPPPYASSQIDLTGPTRIAAGVVMIPAPGHTPGSVLFFVKLADGKEVLFLGDIAWVLSNVKDLATRPRFTQQVFMVSGEDRSAVADQIRALHDLAAAEPALILLPAHDAPVIAQLVASGLLKEQFSIDGP
jgi:glyoxylase-like metal-dependent hydrolase (beta-lactamase superfamily II)